MMAGLANSAWAVAFLQLDISDGAYVNETTHNTTDPFTLWALVDSGSTKYSAGTTYYLSIAVVPKQTADSTMPNFGSFDFNGTVYDANSAWSFGTPPLADPLRQGVPDPDFRNLGPHDIFETKYLEVSFNNPLGRATEYNSADSPGGLVDSANGTLFYNSFEVDTTLLGDGYELHFDLYTIDSRNKLAAFAPFSHDAQTNGKVPDGGTTLVLLGTALTGLGLLRRKFVATVG